MARQFLAISGITFVEVTRQPAFGLVVLSTVIIQALSPALAMFGFDQDLGLMKDFSVSTVFLAGLILAALGASTSMGRELERKTIHTLLSKPVSPGVFLAGRFAGLVASLLAATWLFLLVLLLAARQGPPQSAHHPWDWPVLLGGFGGAVSALLLAGFQSYRTSRPVAHLALKVGTVTLAAGFLLATAFDRHWHLQSPGEGFDPLVAKAVLLVFLGVLLLASVALLLSLLARRGTVLTVILVFLAGLLVGGAESGFSCLLPTMEVYWVGDLFYRPGAVLPWGYLLETALYSSAYSGVCLLVGVFVLERREVA